MSGPEYKPHIDRLITDWSGHKVEGQDTPRLPEPGPAAREVVGPARKTIPQGAAPTPQAPVKRAPRPNYRLPE